MKKAILISFLLLWLTANVAAATPEKRYAVVNLSVCNLHAAADFSSEMITQGLMGMPVHVLEEKGWYHIQTPDDYTGWVHYGGICLMSNSELRAWNAAEKVVVTAHYGFVHERANEKSQTVSDVVAGDRLKYEGKKGRYYKVSYPDGRTGYISKKMAMHENKWRASLKQDAASIISTAYTLLGVPYLWAGTSSKGMDCSGFIRNILYMHDIIIPRDASQQALTGQRLEIAPDFDNLQPGDFVFFGRQATAEQKERVVHVGLYIGNKRFIHAQGDVHISSFDAADPLFDAFNLGRLLFAARILPLIDKEKGLNTTATNPYYK
ncbi:MAG: C40 family peptidase [Mediterranea sp.]|jgi:uncharacterized protein YgiM (DUF1202 family)|nr:C40 family peptidase [Mediterranea sp.]